MDTNKIFKEYGPYVLILIVVLCIRLYVVCPIRVNGSSMYSTLHDGDIMILNIIGYRTQGLKRFDIVVVDDGSEPIVKRVIGLPGEEVSYKNNKLYINGKLVKDPYGKKVTDNFTYKVKNGYFVLGDNRTNSKDSRYFGEFSKKQIKGKTNLILFPFNRFGVKK